MFEQLFTRQATIARHHTSSFAVERLSYLSHLMEQGYSHSRLHSMACLLMAIAQHLSLDRKEIATAEIEASAEAWARTTHRSALCLHAGRNQPRRSPMILSRAVEQYILHKRSLGMGFRGEAVRLRAFVRAIGDCDRNLIEPVRVLRFLEGNGPLTSFWFSKRHTLKAFYRYALARDSCIFTVNVIGAASLCVYFPAGK